MAASSGTVKATAEPTASTKHHKADSDCSEPGSMKQQWESRAFRAQHQDQRGDWIFLRSKKNSGSRPGSLGSEKGLGSSNAVGQNTSPVPRSWILVAKDNHGPD